MRTNDSASAGLGSASVPSVVNPTRDGRRRARPRQAWTGGAPHPFRQHAGTSLKFTGCMEGRLWFIDLGASGFRVGAIKPTRYSKGVSEPLTNSEQEAILAAEQAGMVRLESSPRRSKVNPHV